MAFFEKKEKHVSTILLHEKHLAVAREREERQLTSHKFLTFQVGVTEKEGMKRRSLSQYGSFDARFMCCYNINNRMNELPTQQT